MKTKQVIVVRKDLNMSIGKTSAQCCHASLGAVTNLIEKRKTGPWLFSPTEEMENWLTGSFTKIVVYVDSEEALFQIHGKAVRLGLPCFMVLDEGRTVFSEPTFTVVAVGPAEVSKVNEVTRGLSLL